MLIACKKFSYLSYLNFDIFFNKIVDKKIAPLIIKRKFFTTFLLAMIY